MNYYICAHCGNIITYRKDVGVPVMCCGEKMQELVPGMAEGAAEKHLPVITVDGNTVTVNVGSVEHPMGAEHSIEWVDLETRQGHQHKCLKSDQKPIVQFALTEGDEVVAAYAYCNLHSLWKTEK